MPRICIGFYSGGAFYGIMPRYFFISLEKNIPISSCPTEKNKMFRTLTGPCLL